MFQLLVLLSDTVWHPE